MMMLLYVFIVLIVVVVLLILAAPKTYDVRRSIVINKPIDEVFNYLKYVKNQDHWSPWKRKDPNMKQTFTGTDGTVGFVSKWDSDHKHVGAGEQEIIRIEENKEMETQIRFLRPFKSVSNGLLIVEPIDENTTQVTWGFYGVHKVPTNAMMLFFNMDKAVGKDFDDGLAQLKVELENK